MSAPCPAGRSAALFRRDSSGSWMSALGVRKRSLALLEAQIKARRLSLDVGDAQEAVNAACPGRRLEALVQMEEGRPRSRLAGTPAATCATVAFARSRTGDDQHRRPHRRRPIIASSSSAARPPRRRAPTRSRSRAVARCPSTALGRSSTPINCAHQLTWRADGSGEIRVALIEGLDSISYLGNPEARSRGAGI